MVIFVNSRARGGGGGRRWCRVRRELDRLGFHYEVATPDGASEMGAAVEEAVRSGHTTLVAAGGDGTVNLLLNALMDLATSADTARLALGAIGLGSSNDFHKPFSGTRTIASVPVRISTERSRMVDVGRATVRTPRGDLVTRHFVLSASVGIVAESNARYTAGGRGLDLLKRCSVEAAILWAALATLRRFAPVTADVAIGSAGSATKTLTNISVLKSVHFAGGMRYDTGVTSDDGDFDVNLWRSMSCLGIVRMLPRLYRGGFSTHPATECMRCKAIRIVPRTPTSVELDGEVIDAVAVDMQVLPRAIRVCG